MKTLGFECANTVGSHAQYIAIVDGKKHRVTVDSSIDDFDEFLLKSMISQSGYSRDKFYGASKSAAKKIGKKKA